MKAGDGQKTAVVIGAGVGGVATAARLAKAGFRVTVVEKNDYTGGRCSLIREKGYRFDQGPSLLLLPRLFSECFADLSTSLPQEGVQLRKCEPNYHVWFGDGEVFALSTDMAQMKTEIERFEGPDGFERYLSFLAETHRHYESSIVHVLNRNFESLLAMARPAFLKHLLDLHPFGTVYGRAKRYFWTERLRRVFTFASMYMGMSPFDAPGTYSLLQYTELAEGIWYPVGGFHKVVEALVGVGKRLGVEYRVGTEVSGIELAPGGKRATGVRIKSSKGKDEKEGKEELLQADIVICNADLVYAYNRLLPPSRYGQSLCQRKASCSSISFYWGLDSRVEQLLTHNIFLADEFRESFDSIFKEQRIPAEPSFYVNVPSRVDATAAPPGRDTVVVLVPVGHLKGNFVPDGESSSQQAAAAEDDWAATVSRARAMVLKTVRDRLGVDLAARIVVEKINTPLSWQSEFNLDRGAILGLSHSFFNVLSFRPRTRHDSIKGLYFAGASTHPGTGVPICLAGSKLVAEQVLDDVGREVPWSRHPIPTVFGKATNDKAEVKEIDRVQEPGGGRWIWILSILLSVIYLFVYLPTVN